LKYYIKIIFLFFNYSRTLVIIKLTKSANKILWLKVDLCHRFRNSSHHHQHDNQNNNDSITDLSSSTTTTAANINNINTNNTNLNENERKRKLYYLKELKWEFITALKVRDFDQCIK